MSKNQREIEKCDFNKNKKRLFDDDCCVDPNGSGIGSLGLTVPKSPDSFFSGLASKETIFQKMGSREYNDGKKHPIRDEIAPEKPRRISSNLKKSLNQNPEKTSKGINSLKKYARNQELPPCTLQDQITESEPEYPSSLLESGNEKSSHLEINWPNFSLSSFNSPDTEEVAKEEDRFWKEERKDPIIDIIFEDYEKDKSELSTIDVATRKASLMSNLKDCWGQRHTPGILKIEQKRQNKEEPKPSKRRRKRKVSFNQHILVKLISTKKRKSLDQR